VLIILVMCAFMTDSSLVLSEMDETQVGSWLCQTVVWPRTSLPFVLAKLTRKSAPVSVNLPSVPSVASHFMLLDVSTIPFA
jgi:hypothetical protein